MIGFDELGLRNRRTIPFASVPLLPVDAFRATIAEALGSGWRAAAFFGLPDDRRSDAAPGGSRRRRGRRSWGR